MALSGALMKYIGNEMLPAATGKLATGVGSQLAKATGGQIAKNLATQAATSVLGGLTIPVSKITTQSANILVKAPEMVDLYRGISAKTPEELASYVRDMTDTSISPRTYGGGNMQGEGYNFATGKNVAEHFATRSPVKENRAILATSVPKNRFITQNAQNGNRLVDFIQRAEKRGIPYENGASAAQGVKDMQNYFKRNGILGVRSNSGETYVINSNNDAWLKNLSVTDAMRGRGERIEPDNELLSSLRSLLPKNEKSAANLADYAVEMPTDIQHASKFNLSASDLTTAPKGVGSHQGLLYASPRGEVPTLGSGSTDYAKMFYGGTGSDKVLDLSNKQAADILANMVEQAYDNLDVSKFNTAAEVYYPETVRALGKHHADLIRQGKTEELSDQFGVLRNILGNNDIGWLKGTSDLGEQEFLATDDAVIKRAFEKYIEPETQYSKVDSQLSPQQQEFFKDSVVRDDNGNLMPMYHGSSSDFTVFDINKSGKSNPTAQVGFWFTPNKKGAKKFAQNAFYGDNKPKTFEVYLNMKNPKVYNDISAENLAKSRVLEKENVGLKKKIQDLSDEIVWGDYENRTAEETNKIRDEISSLRKLYSENEKAIEDLSFGDSYEAFRNDIYAIEGQRPFNANIGGLGMGLNNSLETIPKYVQSLKDQGYDGIIIKGTHYDSSTLGWQNGRPWNDQYVVFDPEQIKNVDNLNPTGNPDIRYDKNGRDLLEMHNRILAMRKSMQLSDNVKRVGSIAVGEIDADTLPAGYEMLKKYLEADPTTLVENAVGTKLDATDLPDKLKMYLEGEGYEVKPNVVDNLNTARKAIADRLADDLSMEGASNYSTFVRTRSALQADNPGRGVGVRDFTIDANKDQLYQTEAAKLDREYSDRLGIGRSFTPMSDKVLSNDAKGYYMGGGIGVSPDHSTGETGVSTVAHERMHSWQDIKKGEWDERVYDAVQELRDELKKYYHTKAQIKEYRKSGADLDYYANNNEQEARMLQSYLDNEGYTDTWMKKVKGGTEWGNEVKPAFDKFYKKLRELSKAGVALPAIALMFGLSTNKDDKKLDNIE